MFDLLGEGLQGARGEGLHGSAAAIKGLGDLRFGEISVISYRDESLGDLPCGPQSRFLPVVVTWKPGEGESRRVIAAEFVPDGFVP